jgi:hypothetical protein
VIVTLDEPAGKPLMITFEKHRVYADGTGKHEICIIIGDYFTEDGYPRPLKIEKGGTYWHDSSKGSERCKNPPCSDVAAPPEPIGFPDWLMLTALVTVGEPPGDLGTTSGHLRSGI